MGQQTKGRDIVSRLINASINVLALYCLCSHVLIIMYVQQVGFKSDAQKVSGDVFHRSSDDSSSSVDSRSETVS